MLHVAGGAEAKRAVAAVGMTGGWDLWHRFVAPPQASTVRSVVGRDRGDQLQVLQAVVGLVAVEVMDDCGSWDRTVCRLPNVPVFENPASISQGQAYVPNLHQLALADSQSVLVVPAGDPSVKA